MRTAKLIQFRKIEQFHLPRSMQTSDGLIHTGFLIEDSAGQSILVFARLAASESRAGAVRSTESDPPPPWGKLLNISVYLDVTKQYGGSSANVRLFSNSTGTEGIGVHSIRVLSDSTLTEDLIDSLLDTPVELARLNEKWRDDLIATQVLLSKALEKV